MPYRRIVARCYHSNDLSGDDQKSYADDVESRLDGTGISGYFVARKGTNWIEWEGDPTTIQQKVNQHVNDSRVSSHDIVEDVQTDDRVCDDWRAHTDSDTHAELP